MNRRGEGQLEGFLCDDGTRGSCFAICALHAVQKGKSEIARSNFHLRTLIVLRAYRRRSLLGFGVIKMHARTLDHASIVYHPERNCWEITLRKRVSSLIRARIEERKAFPVRCRSRRERKRVRDGETARFVSGTLARGRARFAPENVGALKQTRHSNAIRVSARIPMYLDEYN